MKIDIALLNEETNLRLFSLTQDQREYVLDKAEKLHDKLLRRRAQFGPQSAVDTVFAVHDWLNDNDITEM